MVANNIFYTMVGEINTHCKSDAKIGFFAGSRLAEVRQRHAALFPQSQKRKWLVVIMILGMGICLSTAILAIAFGCPFLPDFQRVVK